MNEIKSVRKAVDSKNVIFGDQVYSANIEKIENLVTSSGHVDIGTASSDSGSQDTFPRAETDSVKDAVTTCCSDNHATCSERRVGSEQNGSIADRPHTDTNSGSKPAVFYLGGEDGPRSFDSLPTVGQHCVRILALLLALVILWILYS